MLASVLFLGVLAALTLGPLPRGLLDIVESAVRAMRWFDWMPLRLVEQGANVFLFVPAGFLLCSLRPRWRKGLVWAVCVVASLAIEVVQLALPGREASGLDVVLNATGAAVGISVHKAYARWSGRGQSVEVEQRDGEF